MCVYAPINIKPHGKYSGNTLLHTSSGFRMGDFNVDPGQTKHAEGGDCHKFMIKKLSQSLYFHPRRGQDLDPSKFMIDPLTAPNIWP